MAKTKGEPIATSKPSKMAKKPAVKETAEIAVTEKKETEKKETKKKAVPAKEEKTAVKTQPKARAESADDKVEVPIEKKLIALYSLQQVDSQVDKIRIIRGELPLEVQDLEDEIAGLETRVENYIQETLAVEKSITEKKTFIKDCHALIKKYEDQQMNVRNNREYDSLTKEIEFQNLEIQLAEKRIKEFQASLDVKKEEQDLITFSEKNRKYIEERLLTAYTRIRKNARNGLAVVQIERDACGGCFNKIPPQHQLDIRMHKKIIVCEYCGRILVDDEIVQSVR